MEKELCRKTFKLFRLFFFLFLYFPCLMTVYIHWLCYGIAIHILRNNSNQMTLFFSIIDIRKCILIYICNDTSFYQVVNIETWTNSHICVFFSFFCVFIVRWINNPWHCFIIKFYTYFFLERSISCSLLIKLNNILFVFRKKKYVW